MPSITAVESTPFIDEGLYEGTVTAIEEQPSTTPGWADQFKFTFVLDGQFHTQGEKIGQPIDIWHWCSQKLTPKSNLWAIASALGTPPVLGEDLNTDVLIGRKVKLVIKHVDSKSGPVAKVVDMMKIGSPLKENAASIIANAAPGISAKDALENDWCVVCARKNKQVARTHYSDGGEGLCAAHDPEDIA